MSPKKTAQSALRHPLLSKCLKSREQGWSWATSGAPSLKKVSLQSLFAKNFRKFLRKFYFCKNLRASKNSGSNWQKLQILFAIKFIANFLQFSRALALLLLFPRAQFFINFSRARATPKIETKAPKIASHNFLIKKLWLGLETGFNRVNWIK